MVIGLARNSAPPPSPEWALALQQTGDRWYQLSLEHSPIGYLHSASWVDDGGQLHFRSDFRFALDLTNTHFTIDELVFHPEPPHRLVAAHHERGPERRALNLEARDDPVGYQGQLEREGLNEPLSLHFEYRLADYLALELWLQEQQPIVDETLEIPRLDFDRIGLARSTFRIVRVGPTYVVENAAPLSELRITLNDQLLPEAMTIAGLFELERKAPADILRTPSGLTRTTYQIPLDRKLTDHQRLRGLQLAVAGADAVHLDNPLRLQAGALSTESREGRWDTSSLDVSLKQPELLALAAKATPAVHLPEQDDERALADLVDFVNRQLRYEPGLPGRPLSQVLRDRSGDCTDYADLFTGLARLRGWPARTVIGLAYAEQPEPGFAFHAWNEVQVSGRWRAVDPTWNQVRVDATHMPLPPDSALSLRLATGRADVRFRVLGVEHFE